MANEQQERTLTPVGRFRGKVTDHDMGKASTGNPQIAVSFTFNDNEGKAHYITWYGVFTEATIASEHGVCQSLRSLGWDPEEQGWAVKQLAKKSAINPVGGVLLGREADITIEHDTYKGEKKAKVAWVNPPGGGMMKDRCETVESLDEVSSLIRSLAGAEAGPEPTMGQRKAPAATQKAASGAAAPRAPVSGAAAKADDLPF